MRKLFVFLMVLVISILAFSSDKITVFFGAWMEGNFETFKEVNGYDLLEKFTEETGIQVEPVFYPFRELFQAIETRMQAKSVSPDVFEVDSPLSLSYYVRGYTEPLDAYFSEEELDKLKKKMFPATVKIAEWNGKLLNLPFENSSQVMYINKDLFRKAGIEPPKMDVNDRWTWEQVVDAAIKIQKTIKKEEGKEVWGLLFGQVSRPYQMLAIPQSLGAGSGVSPDGYHVVGYLNNDGWKKAMKWWYDVCNTYKIVPKGVTPEETTYLFLSGKVAMLVQGTWDIPTILQSEKQGELGFEWGIAPHPYFKDGKPVTPTNSWHLAVNPNSKKIKAGIEFLKFMSREDIIADWFRAVGQLVANREAMTRVIQTDPKYKEFPWNSYSKIVLYELQNTAEPRPKTPFYLEWEDLVAKCFEDIRNGADPVQTLERYTQIIERLAQKYRGGNK
ncbi:MAG TPA: extracellular solute-binding protein [Thermotogaceae bacterium]|nr:extracellular solute-binding protein [Thermotogaceae bacterium]